MSVTSTRRVSASTSYRSSAPRNYGVAQGGQSFVETIDTTNNVLIKDETQSGHKQYFNRETPEEETFEVNEAISSPLPQNLSQSSQQTPLLDNDETGADPAYQNKNVGIYGTNQQISSSKEVEQVNVIFSKEERVNNPYFKHFYENNEVIEDVDEFV